MENNLSKTSETLKDDLKETTQDIKDRANDMYSKTVKEGKKMSDNIEQSAYDMGKGLREGLHKIELCTKDGIGQIENQVRSYPLLTIGLSMLAGMVVYKLFSPNK